MSGTVMHSSDGFTQRVKLLTGKDGWPIALGDWRYGEDGEHWYIVGIGESYVWGEQAGERGQKRLRPKWLTKEKPDSWERAHAYINAYRVQSVRTEDSTAVMSVVQDLCRRAYELGGGNAELDGAKEDVAALVGILRKLAVCALTGRSYAEVRADVARAMDDGRRRMGADAPEGFMECWDRLAGRLGLAARNVGRRLVIGAHVPVRGGVERLGVQPVVLREETGVVVFPERLLALAFPLGVVVPLLLPPAFNVVEVSGNLPGEPQVPGLPDNPVAEVQDDTANAREHHKGDEPDGQQYPGRHEDSAHPEAAASQYRHNH